jgi:hypothetical protein
MGCWVCHTIIHGVQPMPFHRARTHVNLEHGGFWPESGLEAIAYSPHDHHPVHDAMGTVEAFARLLIGERWRPQFRPLTEIAKIIWADACRV